MEREAQKLSPLSPLYVVEGRKQNKQGLRLYVEWSGKKAAL